MLIEDTNIDDYIQKNGLQISRYYRNQVKQDNLIGDRTIDRGKVKFKITIKLNVLTNIEWSPLIVSLNKISFNVTFFDANLGVITRKFSCDSISATRFLVVGDTEYYNNISIAMEEL